MKNSLGWKPVVYSGIIAGVVFLMAEMLMLVMAGQSPFGPPRMMAAIVMGEGVLPPPASFDLMIMIVAMMVHLMLSIAFAFVFGLIYKMFDRSATTAIMLGAAFGLVMYFVNFYVMTGIWPWFAMARGMISIIGHVLYGAALGWAFHHFSGVKAAG